jgi:hypothetical protein
MQGIIEGSYSFLANYLGYVIIVQAYINERNDGLEWKFGSNEYFC